MTLLEWAQNRHLERSIVKTANQTVLAMSCAQCNVIADNLNLLLDVCLHIAGRDSDGRAGAVHKVLPQRVNDAAEPGNDVVVFAGTGHHNP